LQYEGNLEADSEAFVQAALLYTTLLGERRIRVHTLAAPVVVTFRELFAAADLDAIMCLSLKETARGVRKGETSLGLAQKASVRACVAMLAVYRRRCSQKSPRGQLVLPETLRLLPLRTLGLVKHPLLLEGMSADTRALLFLTVSCMPVAVAVALVCPRLYRVDRVPPGCCLATPEGRVVPPPSLALNATSIVSDGLFLIDNGNQLLLYVGQDLDMNTFKAVFGRARTSHHQGALRVETVEGRPDAAASRLRLLIDALRRRKPCFQSLQVVCPGNTSRSLDETNFQRHLVEDGQLFAPLAVVCSTLC
jgi:protein transport protein SEC24